MLKVLIIDDELNSIDVLSSILKNLADINIVGIAQDSKTGIKQINSLNPDLVFLDIELGENNGFDILKKWDTPTFKTIIITGHKDYALKAFKANVTDYILKPYNSTELYTAIGKVKKQLFFENTLMYSKNTNMKESRKITLKTMENIYNVTINDIVRCESDNYYTVFFLLDGQKIMVSLTLKEYEDILTQYGFLRIHQSHLINMEHLVRYRKTDGGFAVMKDGSQIPVSSRKKDWFLQILSGN